MARGRIALRVERYCLGAARVMGAAGRRYDDPIARRGCPPNQYGPLAPEGWRIMAARHSTKATAGFTLLEALIATALMAIILAALATITAQWLPNWNRGLARLQRNEHMALGLDR